MQGRSLGMLAAAAVVAVAGAIWMRGRDHASTAPETLPERLFPALEDHVNELHGIEVRKGGETTSLKLVDKAWVMESKGGYPVDLQTVRKVAVGMARLQPTEAMTSNPELYAKIGVQDPAAGADSAQVTLLDASGGTLAALIVGQSSYRGGSAQCVRKPGDAQAWKVAGDLGLPPEATGWLDKQILKVERERLQRVAVTQPGGSRLEVMRDEGQTDFHIVDLPADWELKYPTSANVFSSALEYLELQDVTPAGAVDLTGAAETHAEFHTYDGLVLTVSVANQEGKDYARFRAEFEEPAPPPEPAEGETLKPRKPADEVQKEVADLNARTGAWLYVLPSYKATAFTRKLEDLAQPRKPEPTPPTAEPETPAPEASPGGEPEPEPKEGGGDGR